MLVSNVQVWMGHIPRKKSFHSWIVDLLISGKWITDFIYFDMNFDTNNCTLWIVQKALRESLCLLHRSFVFGFSDRNTFFSFLDILIDPPNRTTFQASSLCFCSLNQMNYSSNTNFSEQLPIFMIIVQWTKKRPWLQC